MNRVILGDWMLNDIPDKSIDVISADPPYYNVKGDFDFIWDSFEDYLKDVEKWAIECKRVLKDNGSLFWFGDRKNIAYSQVIFDKYFNLENNIYWQKAEKCQMEMFDTLRSFYCRGFERILFYSNEIISINGLCVNNARDYIRSEIIRAKGKIILKEVNIALGTASNGGGVASSVLSLDKTEPCMITEEHYLKIREWLNDTQEYEYLRKEYEDLRKEYEDLRRPFNNDFKLSDHFFYTNEMNKWEHQTKKPVKMIKQMLHTTTRKDSKVLIPFGGSGTDVEACIDLGLNYTCYEIDPKHYETIKKREKECLKQPMLF